MSEVDDDELAGLDDDDAALAELDDGRRSDDVDRDGAGVACPECGKVCSNKITLGMHRRSEHGIVGNRKKKGKSSSSSSSSKSTRRPSPAADTGRRSKRARLVSETATELADLFERKVENVAALTLAEIIRRDADKMGAALAAVAERSIFGWLGPLIDNVFGDGGPLSILRAFGPTARKFVSMRPEQPAPPPDVDPLLQAEFEQRIVTDGEDAAYAWAAQQGLEVRR